MLQIQYENIYKVYRGRELPNKFVKRIIIIEDQYMKTVYICKLLNNVYFYSNYSTNSKVILLGIPITNYYFNKVSKILSFTYQGAALIIQFWWKKIKNVREIQNYMENWLWRPICMDDTQGINCSVCWKNINNLKYIL